MLGFIFNAVGGHYLVDLIQLTFSQVAAKESLTIDPIKFAMRWSQYSLYLSVLCQGLFLVLRFAKLKINKVAGLAILLLIPMVASRSFAQVEAKADFNWMGSAEGYEALNAKASKQYSVKKGTKLDAKAFNIRSSARADFEVYNTMKGAWFPVKLPSCALTASTENSKAGSLMDCAGPVFTQVGSCDPVEFKISIKDSTPKATVYVNNDPWGTVDDNGRLNTSPYARCMNTDVPVEAELVSCDRFSDSVRVDGPITYSKPIKLSCASTKVKRTKRKNRG